MSNSFRYSIQSFLEAKKIFQRSEDNYSNNVNKKPEKTLCPSLNYTILNHCLNNNLSSLNNEQKNSEGIYKMFMAKQEIYQESEKIYHEKMNFLIESVKNSCKDAIHNTHQAYGRIKSLYEKGVINFYDEEKRIMLEEKSFINIKEMKNMYNNENKYFFQSPIKNSLRKSPNFSNFDSEVRYQFSDPRVQNKKTSLSKIIKKESELFVTFNDKSDKKGEKEEIIQDSELKESIKSSEYELNCRMKKNEGNLNESLDIIVNKSKGLVLKKSEEFSLKGKLRYSEEQT